MQINLCQYEDQRWNQYVSSHPAGTFFHDWKWREVISSSFGYEPYYLVAEERGEITGLLPLFSVKSLLFGRSMVALPLAVYGGVLASNAAAEQMLIEKAMKLGAQQKAKYLEIRGNPYYSSMVDGPVNVGGEAQQKDLYVTFIGDIDPNDDVNLSRIPRKQRRMVKQGEKHGLSFVQNNNRLNEFYQVYASSVHNLGTPVYSFEYFQKILGSFGDRCKIFLIDHEQRAIAGVMVFFFKDQVLPYYGGAIREQFQMAPNDFMYWQLMRYGAAHGYKIFDFGRSKQGTGSFNFKRHWGFNPRPLPYQYFSIQQGQVIPDTSSLNPKLQWAIRIWRNLPLKLTMALGPRIVRHIP